MRKSFLAVVAAGGCLVAMQASALAQAAAFPQTFEPDDFSYQESSPGWNTPNWNTPGAPVAPRYYNQVPTQRLDTLRDAHRRAGQQNSGLK